MLSRMVRIHVDVNGWHVCAHGWSNSNAGIALVRKRTTQVAASGTISTLFTNHWLERSGCITITRSGCASKSLKNGDIEQTGRRHCSVAPLVGLRPENDFGFMVSWSWMA